MGRGNGAESPAHCFTAEDIAAILREHGWVDRAVAAEKGPASEDAVYKDSAMEAWLVDAAALLGPHAADVSELASLVALIFEYDARAILASLESHTVLAREGARQVIRELAHLVLDGPEIDSDRFKEIVTTLKTKLRYSGRELFHPIRLALAGRAGEGELDRVILLLDPATRLPFRGPVKGTRQRMLEFCAALD